VNAYAPDHSSFISNEKVALGKILFSDPILSGTGKEAVSPVTSREGIYRRSAKNTIIGQGDCWREIRPPDRCSIQAACFMI
jgi:hypothetical protein